MPARIAIVGSNSFIARRLIGHLRKTSCHITGFGRRNDGLLDEHHAFDYPQVPVDFDKLLGFDHVLYCAGSGVQAGTTQAAAYALNVFLPVELALYLSEKKFAGKLITFGSYFEIGHNQVSRHFSEEELVASIRPVPNAYCVSKRMLTRFWHDSRLALDFYHLILPTIYGRGENDNRLIPYLLDALSAGREPALTSGEQTRQYLHADDLSRLLEIVLLGNDLQPGLYNVPGHETIQIRGLVQTVYQKMGVPPLAHRNHAHRADETMPYLSLDGSRLRSALPQWEPRISISSGIKEYLSSEERA